MSTVQIKKRVVKKSTAATPVDPVAAEEAGAATSATSEGIAIPSSRVHNYISGVKLNKSLDDQVKQVKGGAEYTSVLSAEDVEDVRLKLVAAEEKNTAVAAKVGAVEAGQELASLLSAEEQKRIGEALKKKEEKNAKLAEGDRESIVLKDVAVEVLKRDAVTPTSAVVEVLSKHRAKFSKNSFDVLAAFGDILVEEIAFFTMSDMVAKSKNGRGIIEIKNVHSADSGIKSGNLYDYYSTLPSFVKSREDYASRSLYKKDKVDEADAEAAGEQPEGEAEQSELESEQDPHKINFKFYVKSICNKLKANHEQFKDLKISENFQTLCSNVIIDMLDGATKVSQIVLGVMSTKTLTQSLFRTCVHLLIRDCSTSEETLATLDARL